MVTALWPSSAVENTCDFLVGIVVLRSISRVNTPPSVSMPSDSGVTSSSSTSLTSPCSTPAWIAAPTATTSSGLTPLCGSLPNNCFTTSCTFGMRVMPPTRTTSLISAAVRPASLIACRHGSTVFCTRSSTSASNLARVSFMVRCFGPDASAVMNGRLISVCVVERQLDLGLLGRFLQPLQRELVAAQVDALGLLELVGQIVDQPHVEVFAAQERVAVGGLHLEHAVADLQDGNVEGAAAEVIDRDHAGLLLVEAVGERRRGRLVDDAQHFEAGDLAGVLGGLALGVVEIGRNGDDRLVDLLAEMRLGRLLHLLQDEGGNLRGRIGLAVGLDPGVAVRGLADLVGDELLVLLDHRVVVAAADQPLDREDGLLRIGDRLALGRLADQPLTVIGEGDDRGCGAHALRVLDDAGRLAFHHCDAGIGGAEVDADDLAHGLSSLSRQAGRALDGAHDPTPKINARPPHRASARRLGSYRRGPLRRKDLTASGPVPSAFRTAPGRPRTAPSPAPARASPGPRRPAAGPTGSGRGRARSSPSGGRGPQTMT